MADLPENFRLYEHVKYTVSDKSGAPSKSGSHVRGHERQDAYLYGHPQGRKKRYRSPADFFPHLLWLATGESDDHWDCTCKLCAPENIQAYGKPAKKEEREIKSENTPVPVAKAVKEEPAVKKEKAPAKPVDKPSSLEKTQDAQFQRYLYRVGELVWFTRVHGAFGLGIIMRRDLYMKDGGIHMPKYLVQPLSHPFSQPPMVIVPREDLIRPWLAFSVPGPSHQALAVPGLTFDTIDWRRVIQGHYGEGEVDVDAGIFAAKAVDNSYTPIEPLHNANAEPGEKHYRALFFGGEKIWIDEAIRISIPTGLDIMVLRQIIEKGRPGSNRAPVHLIGDIYSYHSVPYTPGREPADNARLPPRVREDLKWCNSISKRFKQEISYWNLVKANAAISLENVKGRWYESSTLLPILQGQDSFQRDAQQGKLGVVGNWLNARGQSSKTVGETGIKKFDRLEAFGRSVPQAKMGLTRGLDGPPEENVFPDEQQPANAEFLEMQVEPVEQQEPQQVPSGPPGADIAEFMDLDRMEEGFVQQYVENGGSY